MKLIHRFSVRRVCPHITEKLSIIFEFIEEEMKRIINIRYEI